jgi:3-oxoacyl-[acyl-carrier protein] reductase
MDLGLKGKRALVMGSTRGLGRGIAEALAVEGARLGICGRDAAAAEKAAAEIGRGGAAEARGFGVNLLDVASVTKFCDAVTAAFGGLDVLVLNGGGPPPGAAGDIKPEVWAQQFEAMFLAHIRIAARFLPGMRQQKWGRVLVCSSSGAVQPIPALAISNTLRAGLIGWAKTLSAEVAGDGVTVNTLLPGRIKTERVDEIDEATAKRVGKPVEEVVAASKATIPAGRYGTVAEFGAVGAFLVSGPASYVTGSVIRADGGFIRGV